MDLGLTDKSALITGGERGIGRDVALSLAREGADVAYCDISVETGEGSTQQEIRKLGRKAIALEVDVSNADQVVAMVERVIAELGGIDIFISNAGIIEWEPVTEITLERWNRIIGVNLTGAMLCTREVARHTVERRRGTMLFTSSTIQYNPAYKRAAHRVSKAAVQVFAETAAIELAPYDGIRVNTVSPGMIDSPNWANGILRRVAGDPNMGEAFRRNIPLGGLANPPTSAPPTRSSPQTGLPSSPAPTSKSTAASLSAHSPSPILMKPRSEGHLLRFESSIRTC